MAIPERRWWLRLVGALLAVATALVFTLWYVTSVLPFDVGSGLPAITDAVLAFDIVAVLVGVALHAVVKALLARRRAVRLRTSIDSYQDALPLASVAVDAATPSSDLDRMVASWSHPRWAVVGAMVGLLFVAGMIFFMGAWLAFTILQMLDAPIPAWLIAFIQWSHPSHSNSRAVPEPQGSFATPFLTGIFLFGGCTLLSLSMLRDVLATIIFQPLRVEADSEGITWYSVWGPRRRIRWHDARLLEVASSSARQSQYGPMRTYWLWTLYGQESSIRWQQPADTMGPLTDPFAQLTRFVIAHADLEAHTLDQRLLAPGEAPHGTLLDWINAHLTAKLVIAAVGVDILAIGLIQPTLLIGEGIIVGTGIALSLIGKWFKRWSQRRSQDTSAARLPNASAHLTFSADAVYEMTVGSNLYFRFSQVTYIILGAGVALFGLGMLGLEFVQYVLYMPGLHMPPPSANWIAALVCFTIGGILTIIVSVRARDTIMLVDAHGVRKRWLLGNTFIPWDQVESIKLRYAYGNPWWYRVTGGQRKLHVSWPVSPFHPSRTPQERGAILLTPEQMAALISQRTGKPTQTNEQR